MRKVAPSRSATMFPPFCRAGVHARRTAVIQNRDVRNAAGCGGMRASRPTAARAAAAVPVGPICKNIRRGGIYCARRRVSEANRRAAAALGPEIPPAGPAATQGSRDDASIVPYRGLRLPVGRAFAAVRRGGPWPSRGASRQRGVRRDEGIPPYGRPGGRSRSGWPGTKNLFVGAGFIPPAGPCGGASRADMESAPTEVCVCAGVCVTRSAANLPPNSIPNSSFLIFPRLPPLLNPEKTESLPCLF